MVRTLLNILQQMALLPRQQQPGNRYEQSPSQGPGVQ
jgi:hypothetical protein